LEDIDLMISNDTWAMHLSACMWTKTMWLFWPNLPERFWPYPQEKNLALYKWDGKAYINVHLWKFEKCSSEIINKITPKEVYEKIILSFKD
jgi:ADP-heptose:LPS heptosyltransferase